jgi:hypothetical protein
VGENLVEWFSLRWCVFVMTTRMIIRWWWLVNDFRDVYFFLIRLILRGFVAVLTSYELSFFFTFLFS